MRSQSCGRPQRARRGVGYYHLTHFDEILVNDELVHGRLFEQELTLRSCIRTFCRCMLVVSFTFFHRAGTKRQGRQKDGDCSLTERMLRSNLGDMVLRSPDPASLSRSRRSFPACVTQRFEWTAQPEAKATLEDRVVHKVTYFALRLTLHQWCM